jgi:hypothetical protein
LARIEKTTNMEQTRLEEILKTHKIKPEILRSDSFEEFIRDRASNLLDLMETATGKKVSGRDSMKSYMNMVLSLKQVNQQIFRYYLVF